MAFSRTQIATAVSLVSLGGLTGAALSAGGDPQAAPVAKAPPTPKVVTQVVTETTHRVRHVRTRVVRRARRPAVYARPHTVAAQPPPSRPTTSAPPPARPAVKPAPVKVVKQPVAAKPAPATKAPVTTHQSGGSTGHGDDEGDDEGDDSGEDHGAAQQGGQLVQGQQSAHGDHSGEGDD
jgi:hypothetical protein